ncbi:MAG: hypothetical protein CO189_09180 [candidate division Zixibacteria bacterium CG_4_9_14_3_um_filter_46_8]|nr:MAG: hypothetical protein CO189_09180 [candidate division Zixibacteria bacterium CG_4_9_14_3_um_filter_46_8]
MDVNHLPPDDLIFEMFRSHKHFGLKMRHELNRAERYCEFISLVTITIKGGDQISSEGGKNARFGSLDDLHEGLRKVICKSIRLTDYVSGIENDRMGLLLVETPRNGAETLINRIKPAVSGYFSSQTEEERPRDIAYSVLSFPSDLGTKEEFSKAIHDFVQE